MRRICVIGPAGNVHVQRWAAALVEHRYGVSLISSEPRVQTLPAHIQHLPCFTIPTARAGMPAKERLVTLLRGWMRVPALIAALKPDLVHIHSLPTPAAVPFLRHIRPLVVSVWGSDVVQRDRRKTQLYPLLLARADIVTATSRYLADVALSYLARPRTVEVVPFGVDPALFTPAAVPPAALSVGTLRHLEPNYGIDVLLASLPYVVREQPEVRVQIGGTGSLHTALTRQATALGVSQNVRFTGRIAHADVPAWLQTLTLFVMPSRAESFGVAALEAQACGLPVVATDVGGLPEVVRDGKTGLLVPTENPIALATALLTLLVDPQRRADMGQAGRAWVMERYSWHTNVAQMLELYASIG